MKPAWVNTLLLFVLMSLQIHAASEKLFADTLTVEAQDYQKLGEYRYVYGLFFKLYDAALFTPEGSSAGDVLRATTSFHLQFRYLRKIEKSIILKSADRMLEKNLSPSERQQITDRVDRINQAYSTVRQGDTSSLTYQPTTGTSLRINGEHMLTIEGRDFAKLYFRIWLGEKAISPSLKEHLLGRDQ